MEYKKDKRTMNLTLRDIHVGDWVHVWSEYTERYSPPLKIIQICDDGTIYLVTSDEERSTPLEENIKNVDALEITPDLLKGFGFDVVPKDYPKDEFNVLYCGEQICELWECGNCSIETPWNSYEYFHEFVGYLYYVLPKTLKLEWKVVQ